VLVFSRETRELKQWIFNCFAGTGVYKQDYFYGFSNNGVE